MSSQSSRFVDEYFNVHERGTELGRGGQGIVFRTKDPGVAVKLALDGEGRPVTHAGYAEKLRRVRALPVPPGLNLAAPMAVLQGTAGYAMRLLTDMVPFASFWPDPSGRTPERLAGLPPWLASMPEELAFSLVWYRDSGGLQRRLLAFYKCASILARLHGAGLVYGDISPANAFISQDQRSREVWLIDADNLRYETPRPGGSVYTPRFGAPELVQGLDGGRQRTDCHAFAVMAFWGLTFLHPFIGRLVEAGGDADWADDDASATDLDERAYAGHLPWILDARDDRNHKDNGLIALVLTDGLVALFEATFGPGRTQPWMRPAMARWARELARAADQAVLCGGCDMSYLFDFDDGAQSCPFCEAPRPATLVATAHDWLGEPPQDRAPAWRLARSLRPTESTLVLPHRLFYPFSVVDGDRDLLELRWERDELRLTCRDAGHSHRLAVAVEHEGSDAFVEFEGTAAIPLPPPESGFWLRVGGLYPRVVHCTLQRGHL